MNEILVLIGLSYTADEIGNQVAEETRRDVFCEISSISRAEWYDAGRNGMRPAFRATVNFDDYADETLVEHDGKRYAVYRTYAKTPALLELYLEEKAGV